MALVVLATLSTQCGGGGSHKNSLNPMAISASNVQPVVVNSGPAGNYANGLFTSITVCVPSSSNCQTIDGVLVDTGSFGLRLLSSAGGGALTLSLPHQTGSNGGFVGERALFLRGFTLGLVRIADVDNGGGHARNVPGPIIH